MVSAPASLPAVNPLTEGKLKKESGGARAQFEDGKNRARRGRKAARPSSLPMGTIPLAANSRNRNLRPRVRLPGFEVERRRLVINEQRAELRVLRIRVRCVQCLSAWCALSEQDYDWQTSYRARRTQNYSVDDHLSS